MKKKKIKWDRQIWLDISPALSEQTAVFPGDVSFSRLESMSTKAGQHLTLSSIRSTLHIGAHTDAPVHYHAKGQSIDERSLDFYFGKAQVVVIKGKPKIISQKDLPKSFQLKAPRLLFRTSSFHPQIWKHDFSAFCPELIENLAKSGVKLLGIDTPSIDPASSKELLAHQAVFRHNLAILEGLDLSKAKAGLYQLIALPLKISSGDASPVRAALIPLK
jgi:arylformamidase